MGLAGLTLLLAAPALDPAPPQHLLGWERVMTAATAFRADTGTKTVFDPKTKTTKTFTISLWCLKPDRVRLRLERVPSPGQPLGPADFEFVSPPGKDWKVQKSSLAAGRTARGRPALDTVAGAGRVSGWC